ncbi:MAG TPA: hypothetical protein VL461_01835 [Dictyobacter sp.]|nr:hypothetical protein [Dictyobacter sp.]
MPGLLGRIHVASVPGLLMLLVLWVAFYELAHIVVVLVRHEPVIGWAIGPFGLTLMVLCEPSLLYLWIGFLFPALISGGVLYLGLFTMWSPIDYLHDPVFKILLFAIGLLLTSTVDMIRVIRDVRYPLWGEARVLRSIQLLPSLWTKIHFTPFGYSYVRTHFGFNPTELLQVLSL